MNHLSSGPCVNPAKDDANCFYVNDSKFNELMRLIRARFLTASRQEGSPPSDQETTPTQTPERP